MSSADLPAVNATLNAISGLLLLLGLGAIRAGRRDVHQRLMTAAFGVSVLFLICYVTYHALHGSTRFTGTGPVRTVYFAILITHVVLAAAVPPLAIVTLRHGLRGTLDRHRRIARITWPIWMYVSVTGVIVYLMLYQM